MHPRLHAEARPDHVALIVAATGQTITYRDLETRANRGARALRTLGLEIGDTIALLCNNRPEWLDVYWAAQRSGLTLVPASTRLKTEEIAYIAADSGAKAVLISDALADTARVLRYTPGVPALVGIGAINDLPDWTTLAAAEPDVPIADEQNGTRMLYSSGTTGRPKGIRAAPALGSPIQANPGATLFGGMYALGPDTVYMAPAPLYHSAPLGFVVAVQAHGGTVVLLPKFEPEAFLRAIERWRVTTVQVVPTMLIRLLKLPDDIRARHNLSSLTNVIHAAAPCPIPVKRAMINWLGPVIDEFYAGTEGNGTCRITSAEWLARPGSVGRPISGELHICDDSGAELPVGETGTVWFGGGKPFRYHNDDAKTAQSRHPQHDDWSTMGDVGHVDATGYLFLSDRKDFMIISGGINIYPQEVENLLVTHPEVADVAVFGVPNPEFGEEVKAVVQPVDWACAGDALADELVAFCRTSLADVKCPRSIDFDPALPRTDTGKLFKKEVRARYWPTS
ncbi:acyl-CoA synthetase [uncultured Sphingomonas sp.]|uniref:acyl-CoA synthetase n=1 Tax=uncultured Sphingomonas sp. TaxID=158754 RepID=UPI0026396AD0|nr:acyl-CoA synthetase [uncultured Sphingomonas sp.]